MQLLLACILLLLLSISTAFQGLFTYRKFNSFTLNMKTPKIGSHGQNFKYLPIHKGSDEEHFPRIMPIAGVYPSITYEQLMAPRSSEASDPGQWAYEFTDPDGPQIGTVALPGSDTITNCIDPVVMISKNTDLGVSVIEEVEMIVVVDRGDIEFSKENFYLFQDPNNNLIVQWCDSERPDYQVVGKIVLCCIPWTTAMKPKSSGFLEDD